MHMRLCRRKIQLAKMAVVTGLVCVLLALALVQCCHGQKYPFLNTSLSFEDRVKDLVGRLTMDEMVAQMSHGGADKNGPAPLIDRLGIKPYQWGTECLSGDVRAGAATSFPQAIGMAASFNYDMVFKVAKAISDEVRSKNNNYTKNGNYDFHTGLSCWSPVINIFRDPRWGRNQETYGEDPWLSGYLATAYVKGLQGDHPRYVEANAGCKHFNVHGGPENIPVSRFSFDSKVSERDWWMTFLPQFKACVKAGSLSFMCSYNSINGIPACANKELLTDILRNKWGFEGYVVSDQGAVENVMEAHHYTDTPVKTAAAVVNAGTCLEDANMEDNIFTHIGEAVQSGLISPDTVKGCVSQLFMVRMKLGEFDPPEMNPYTKLNVLDYVQSNEHIMLSRSMAAQSMVLLKNEGGLPITTPYSRACVVGPFINSVQLLFGDYAPTIVDKYVLTPLNAIINNGKIAASYSTAEGCTDGTACKNYNSTEIQQVCQGVDIAITFLGIGSPLESEGNDRSDINLPGNQLQLLQDAAGAASKTIVVLYNANPLDVSWAVRSDKVVAILESFYPAQTAGDALLDVLIGVTSPAGRLPNTWPASLDQVPDITDYTMVNRTYRYFQGDPLFPFGYGLSYTTFQYSDLKITPSTIKTGQSVTVTATVTNTGNVNSDEVVQVYISWTNTDIAPIRQLVGVERISLLKPSKSAALNFTITSDEMMLYDSGHWFVPTVEYKVFVGGQQPNQHTSAPSNILDGSFVVQG